MGIASSIFGLVSRALPQPTSDNVEGEWRLGRYRDGMVINLVPTKHGLADEGSYFTTNNAQTGIIGPNSPTAFSDINPSVIMVIANADSPGNAASKRICIDQFTLLCTAAGAAASGLTFLNFGWTTDNGDRYTSGGTDITPNIVNINMDVAPRSSIAKVRFGAITPTAATGSRRTVVGQRMFRPLNTATAMLVAQDFFLMTFGAVEPNFGPQTDLSTAKTSAGTWAFPLPPIEIGPGESALLHTWSPGAALTTGVTFLPELYWFER
jgi:hypothetical protein